MERKLIMRNAACLARVSPSDFGVDLFAERLELGPAGDKVVLGEVLVTEWANARLQILPDRLQLGFKEAADGRLVRRATAEFLTRVDQLAPGAPIDFNAALRLTLEEGDTDPAERLLDAEALAARLGGTEGRGGLTLVCRDDQSRWWIELSPQPDEDRSWVYDFNRRFADFPGPGDAREAVLTWFADIEASLNGQFDKIASGVEQ